MVLVPEIAGDGRQVSGRRSPDLAQMGALVILAVRVVVWRPPEREPWPTFGDTAFPITSGDAAGHAQQALKKAGCGPWRALTHLLTAWEKRGATQLPSAQVWVDVCLRPSHCRLGAGAVCCSEG